MVALLEYFVFNWILVFPQAALGSGLWRKKSDGYKPAYIVKLSGLGLCNNNAVTHDRYLIFMARFEKKKQWMTIQWIISERNQRKFKHVILRLKIRLKFELNITFLFYGKMNGISASGDHFC